MQHAATSDERRPTTTHRFQEVADVFSIIRIGLEAIKRRPEYEQKGLSPADSFRGAAKGARLLMFADEATQGLLTEIAKPNPMKGQDMTRERAALYLATARDLYKDDSERLKKVEDALKLLPLT